MTLKPISNVSNDVQVIDLLDGVGDELVSPFDPSKPLQPVFDKNVPKSKSPAAPNPKLAKVDPVKSSHSPSVVLITSKDEEEEAPFHITPMKNTFMEPAAHHRHSPSSNTSRSNESSPSSKSDKSSPVSQGSSKPHSKSVKFLRPSSPSSKSTSFVEQGEQHTEDLARVKRKIETSYAHETSRNPSKAERCLKLSLTVNNLLGEHQKRVEEERAKPIPRSKVWNSRGDKALYVSSGIGTAALIPEPITSITAMVTSGVVGAVGLGCKGYSKKIKRDENKAKVAAKKKAETAAKYSESPKTASTSPSTLKAEISHKEQLIQIKKELIELESSGDSDDFLSEAAHELERVVTNVHLVDPDQEEPSNWSTTGFKGVQAIGNSIGPAAKLAGGLASPTGVIVAGTMAATAVVVGAASAVIAHKNKKKNK